MRPMIWQAVFVIVTAGTVFFSPRAVQAEASDTFNDVSPATIRQYVNSNSLPALNRKVLYYAYSNMGRCIDRGECAELADRAINYAGGKRTGPYGADADYVWGTYVGVFRSNGYQGSRILPGDILQFRNAKFQGRRGNGTYWSTASHHTSIVANTNGRTLYVLHQNVGGRDKTDQQKRRVQAGSYKFNDLAQGWVKVYRPTSGNLNLNKPGGGVVVQDGGQLWRGQLTGSDSRIEKNPSNLRGSHYDSFNHYMKAGRTYTITLTSSSLDTYLLVLSGSRIVAQDDDSGTGRNARITFRPSSSGTYRIIATTYNAGRTGGYTLSVR